MGKEIEVVDGRKQKSVFDLVIPNDYNLLKIEKLGKEALQQVLVLIKKGHTYNRIATILNEMYDEKIEELDLSEIKSRDVSKVLKNNAELMISYRKWLDTHNLQRANMVMNESEVLVSEMERLEKAAFELENKIKTSLSTKDLVSVSKAISKLSKTRAEMIKNFKKLTGQYKDAPSILIDQSKKQMNVFTDDKASKELASELAKASFNSNKKITDEEKMRNQTEPEKDDVDDNDTVDANYKVSEENKDAKDKGTGE